MKTRTNQPIVLPSTADIEHLSDAFIDQLKCGDIIIKKTGEQRHSYRVSYKQEKHGICLTYSDCGYMETISYDYTDGHWVFNSKDVCEVPTDDDIEEKVVETIEGADEGASPEYMLGLNGNGEFAKFPASSGEEVVAYEGTSKLPATLTFDDWNLHRAIKDGNVLWLVVSGRTNAATELTTVTDICEIELPQDIASKIYTLSGEPITQSASVPFIIFNASVANTKDINIKQSGINKIMIQFDTSNPPSISYGNRLIFNMRVPLFLDIGEVE